MNMSNINNFIKVKNDIFEQQMYPQRKQRYIVGEMSEANFLFIDKYSIKSYYLKI